MADDIDRAQERDQIIREDALEEQRRKGDMPAGAPGECERCGYDKPRLVNGVCAPCRDHYGLG